MAKTLSGTYTSGYFLSNPATQNPLTVTSTGRITGTNITALSGSSAAAWSVTNLGTISGVKNGGTAFVTGVNLNAGGTIINRTGGLISGYDDGIGVFGTAVTLAVTNYGVIQSTQTGPVVAAAGTTFSGFAVQVGISATGVVSNFGTISAAQTNGGAGILLQGGGTVTNGATAALITGASDGVEITGRAGTVTNFGTIASTATGTFGLAVFLQAGGVVTNYGLIVGATRPAPSGTVTGHFGVVDTGTIGATIDNFGTITSSTRGIDTSDGINLLHGGLIVNGGSKNTSALISGNFSGIYGGGHLLSTGSLYHYPGAATTVINFGTIVGSGDQGVALVSGGTVTNFGTIASTATGTLGEAVYLGGGGIITNYGLISGAHPGNTVSGYPGVVQANNQPATLVNLGTITNPNNSNGVNLLRGGLLVNGSTSATTALINGARTGVYMGGKLGVLYPGAVGTIINYGTIQNASTASQGVRLVSGGTVTNLGLISSARTGVSFGDTAGTIANFGTIVSTAPASFTAGAGVYLQAGGVLTNEAGASIIALKAGVSVGNTFTTTASVTISNAGTISGSAGIAIGAYDTGSNIILNSGTIVGTGTNSLGPSGFGVHLYAGGGVTNGASGATSALIAGGASGVNITGSAGTVTNAGTVDATGSYGVGVFLDLGGSILNGASGATAALIAGGGDGIMFFDGAGTVTNAGTITGAGQSGAGIDLDIGGNVVNSATGALIAGIDGINVFSAAGTVTNYGTIASTSLSGLAGAGVYLGAGGTIVNFGAISSANGVAINFGTAGGNEVVIESGSVLDGAVANFQPGDSFDLPFLSFSSGGTATLGSGNVLQIVETSGTFTIDLDPAQHFASDDTFLLGNDGSGGTLVTEDPPAGASLALLGQFAAAGFATAADQGSGAVAVYVPTQGQTVPTLLTIPSH